MDQTTTIPYLLGELKGMLDQVLRNQKEYNDRLVQVEGDLSRLKISKATIVGWTSAISAVVSAAFTVAVAWFTGGK